MIKTGKELKELRTSTNYSQNKLSKLLGVRRSTLSTWECRNSNIPYRFCVLIEHFLIVKKPMSFWQRLIFLFKGE